MIKLPIDETRYRPGDVFVILAEAEETFHGISGKIEDGHAFAYDPKGSLLPAAVQWVCKGYRFGEDSKIFLKLAKLFSIIAPRNFQVL